jgi:mitogen-activated protein kinase kinase
MADQAGFAPRSMKRKNHKGLALTPAAPRPPPTAETVQPDYGKEEVNQTAQLEIGIEYKMDLRPEDLEVLKELGSGNGGTVNKVLHVTTGTVMARKVSSFLGSRADLALQRC